MKKEIEIGQGVGQASQIAKMRASSGQLASTNQNTVAKQPPVPKGPDGLKAQLNKKDGPKGQGLSGL